MKESPDAIRNAAGKPIPDLKFSKGKAYPFGYYNKKFYLGNEGQTHGSMQADDEVWLNRKRLKYSGRIWIEPKQIVSFWNYPKTKDKMKKVISDLDNAFKVKYGMNLNIWNKFKLDILIKPNSKSLGGKFSWEKDVDNRIGNAVDTNFKDSHRTEKYVATLISFDDYDTSIDYKGSSEDVPHIKSPMIKGASNVSGEIGSKKRPGGLTATQLHQLTRTSDGVIKLKSLVEYTIGKVSKEINVKIDIDKTYHAGQQQVRPEGGPINDTSIIEIVNLALPKIADMLIFDEINMGDYVLIKHRGTMINIVGALNPGNNDEIDFVVVTVMRKENFIPKQGTKVIEI